MKHPHALMDRVASKPSLLFLVLLAPSCILSSQESHDHAVPEKLGTVSFPTSCQPAVQAEFLRAVAHWGVAMTYFHELWDPPIRQDGLLRGRDEIRRAQRIGRGSDRERRFIRALGLFYAQDPGAVPYQPRVSKYASAMGKLAAAHPQDVESQVFYALALLASASPFDKTHTAQKHAGQILDPLFHQYPQHPGIAHYLIHACDNQEMAAQGLAAARAYSKIAPAAPHALHMPSHIFTRLGLWDDSIASNQAAQLAARQQADVGEELHAMDYLVYADLQQGREREAVVIVEQLKAMRNLDASDFKVAYASVAVPVRYVMERGQWAEAAKITPPKVAPPQAAAVAVWACAIGLARSGRSTDARKQVVNLRQLAQQLRASHSVYGEYWARQVDIQALEALAWSDEAERREDDARKLLKEAADEEDSVEKLPVTPGPILPAREQLADILLEQNQPELALKQFQAALSNAPGRRAAITGMARACQMLSSR